MDKIIIPNQCRPSGDLQLLDALVTAKWLTEQGADVDAADFGLNTALMARPLKATQVLQNS